MPPKGFRSLNEDTISVSTRVPLSLVPEIEKHTARLKRQTPYLKVSQADALRDLLIRGLQSANPQLKLFGEEEETQSASSLANAVSVAESIIEKEQTGLSEMARMPLPPTGHVTCEAGYGHPPYPTTFRECPKCRNAKNKRASRARKKNQTASNTTE